MSKFRDRLTAVARGLARADTARVLLPPKWATGDFRRQLALLVPDAEFSEPRPEGKDGKLAIAVTVRGRKVSSSSINASGELSPEHTGEAMKSDKKAAAKNCSACKHSYMEPDSDLICGAVNSPFGRTIRKELEHCDGGKKFEQHPLRNADGSLK